MRQFIRKGGVIEGYPYNYCKKQKLQVIGVSFKIEPDGQITYLGSYQKIRQNKFKNIGCETPTNIAKTINEIELIS